MRNAVGHLAQIKAFVENTPAAQSAVGTPASFTFGGATYSVPVGTLSGAAPNLTNAWQWSARVDHRFNDKHSIGGRIMYDTRETVSGQAVPPGLTSQNPVKAGNYTANLTSSFSPSVFNELRGGYGRQTSVTLAADQKALNIPSIEINSLGLIGFNAATSRTAIGLAVNLPQASVNNNYQISDNFSVLRGNHAYKMGFDFRRQEQFADFNPTVRGRLQYPNLQDFVDDVAQTASINVLLPGVPRWQNYRYYDYFFYVQDEWRVKSNFTLTYGIRYETPGNAFAWLKKINDGVVASNNNNPAYRMDTPPQRDKNNWAPRFGFNYRPQWGGMLTGNGKLVLRGGYSRTYDIMFNNIALNMFSAWPFTAVVNLAARSPRSFATIDPLRAGTTQPVLPSNLNTITRTIVDAGFRAPLAEQFSFQIQREFGRDWVFSTGWVGTKGTGLFQSLDGNPNTPGANPVQRVDPTRGIIRHRANSASSVYHSWQSSLEKRLSRNFSMAGHYTWSAFIDDASEVFNPSVAGEIAVPQNSFNRAADRGRSTYDRPHRFSINGTFELPFMREQQGFVGRWVGGWVVSGFLTLQAGPPFSPLAGIDPGLRLSGIDSLIGNAIRPHVNTSLDLSSMKIEEVFRAGTYTGGIFNLFSPVTAASPIGNAGRNILRADGINNIDLAINKKWRLWNESHALNFRAEFYNLTNSRDFGIPTAFVNNAGFGNQWNTDGGKRRVVLGLRYTF